MNTLAIHNGNEKMTGRVINSKSAVTVLLHIDGEDVRYMAETLYDAIKDMWWDYCELSYEASKAFDSEYRFFTFDGYDGCFTFVANAFHHCFDNGHLDLDEMLDILEAA